MPLRLSTPAEAFCRGLSQLSSRQKSGVRILNRYGNLRPFRDSGTRDFDWLFQRSDRMTPRATRGSGPSMIRWMQPITEPVFWRQPNSHKFKPIIRCQLPITPLPISRVGEPRGYLCVESRVPQHTRAIVTARAPDRSVPPPLPENFLHSGRMVGVNIGDTLTPTPWAPEKIGQALTQARSSGYFSCDAVKFWHCDASRVLPTAQQDHIRKVRVGVCILRNR